MHNLFGNKVEGAALDLAKNLASSMRKGDIPVDIDCIARKCGVVRIEGKDMAASGYLLCDQNNNRLVIQYRNSDPPSRRRFTIAHEVGHILLSQALGARGPENCARCSSGEEHEGLANHIAGELLMPEKFVVKDFRDKTRWSCTLWSAIEQVADLYNVSKEAVVYRVLHLPHFLSILIKISLDPSRRRIVGLECRSSRGNDIRFLRPLLEEADRIWREAVWTSTHEIEISTTAYDICTINVEGKAKPIYQKDGRSLPGYWIFGWC